MSRRIVASIAAGGVIAAGVLALMSPAAALPECSGEPCRMAELQPAASVIAARKTSPGPGAAARWPAPAVASKVAPGAGAALPPTYGIQHTPFYAPRHASSVVVVSAPTIYGDNGVLIVHPDSSWKLCQGDHSHGRRYQYCGPHSYHPYGSYGYRPLGTYREYRPSPSYVYAPSARIITIGKAD